MGRPKKDPVLTELEKKYINLVLGGGGNPDMLFARISAELNKPEELIRIHAENSSIPLDHEPNLPPEPKTKKVLKPEQKFIRDSMTPNRHDTIKAKHVTVFNEMIDERIANIPQSTNKSSGRYTDCVFRQEND